MIQGKVCGLVSVVIVDLPIMYAKNLGSVLSLSKYNRKE